MSEHVELAGVRPALCSRCPSSARHPLSAKERSGNNLTGLGTFWATATFRRAKSTSSALKEALAAMSDVYMIEIDDAAVGLVARESVTDSYRFHAAVPGL